MPFSVAEVANHLQGKVIGDAATILNGFAPAERAKNGDLTFAENEGFFAKAEQTAASAIIVSGEFKSAHKTLIQVTDARVAFAKALELFFPELRPPAGVHPTAVIAATAKVDPTAHVGPHCVVGERTHIGERCVLHGGDHIGADCRLGNEVILFPNVTLYPRTELGQRVRIHAGVVVGGDGYGYVQDNGTHRKVPQIGSVIIGDDVEIGANTTIDRGALGPTVIGKGTKIDNLVMIGHNVEVGEHCLIVGQVGIAGSTKLGNYVVLAGQVGIAGHLKIGNHVTVAAQSGVMTDIPDGGKWLGAPAQPDKEMKRQFIAMKQLPDWLKRIAALERAIGLKDKSP